MKQPNTTDKLTEKAFSRLMLMSALGIIITLAMLCSATWAWFKTDISSSNNTLRTASSNAEVTVLDANDAVVQTAGTNPEGHEVYIFEANTPYTVLLTTGEADTANAYCTVWVNGFPYHSEPLFASSPHHSFSFQLQFSEKQVGIQILPRWGIPNAEMLFEADHFYLDLVDTKAPVETTETPAETTEEPVETTETPVETSEEPVETTETPAETTEEPVETTETPAETTEEPVETTETPVETTEEPVDTTETPVETTEEPVETTETPAETTEETVETTETPVETTEELTETEEPIEN